MSDSVSAEKAERHAVLVATGVVCLLVAEQVAARAARDALFLAAYRVKSLPFMMMASALVALAGAEALSAALARRAPSRVVPAGALLSALTLALLFPVAVAFPRAAAILVYLHVAAFGGALVSGFWSFVNEQFDPYTARRVVGRIGTGATAGGVAGGGVGWLAAHALPVPAVLLVLAALHAAAAVVLLRAPHAEPGRPATTVPAGAGAALPVLLRTPYLRQLALVVSLGAVVEAIVDWTFKAEVQKQYASGGGGALLAPLSAFYAFMSVASLLLQATLARPALTRLGIAGTVAIRPLLTALGSLLGSAAPRLSTATLARGGHEAITNSLFRSGYELLYTPVPEAEKRRIKAVIDVALDKGGALVGSGLILAALAVAPASAERTLFALAAALSLGALALSRGLHRGYVRALEQSLLLGRVRLEPGDALDRATQQTLAHSSLIDRATLLLQIEAHRAGQPGSTASGVPTLEHAGGTSATPATPAPLARARDAQDPVEALLLLRSGDSESLQAVLRAHPEPPPLLVAALVPCLAGDQALSELLAALRRAAPRVTGQLVDALLDTNEHPLVRQRLARVLKACPSARAVEGLVAALDDPSFDLRAAGAAALAGLHETSSLVHFGRHRVFEQVRRELDSGETVDRQLPHVFALLSLTLERQALRIAWTAMKSSDRALRGTALEYLNNVLPEDVFPRVRSLFGASTVVFAARERPAQQVTDELLTSSAGLRLERPPWQDGGDGDQSGS